MPMTPDQAEALLRDYVKKVGPGFHPDTRGDEYDPPLEPEDALQLDDDLERVFHTLGADRVYLISLNEWQKLYGADKETEL